MTLARPPMVLSTHTICYFEILQNSSYQNCKEKILMQILSLRVTFLLFSKTMKINWLHFIWYADVPFNTRRDYQTFGNINLIES